MARKRGQNEGSIFRRRDGRWCAILNLGWENGKRRRKHLYGATAAEVQEQLLKGRMDHARGLPVAMERQRLRSISNDGLRTRSGPAYGPFPGRATASRSGSISALLSDASVLRS